MKDKYDDPIMKTKYRVITELYNGEETFIPQYRRWFFWMVLRLDRDRVMEMCWSCRFFARCSSMEEALSVIQWHKIEHHYVPRVTEV